MNEFWIFLLVAGVIISFAKKEDKARKKRGSADTDTTQDSSREELDRQLRELFGEEYTPQQPSSKIIKPVAKKATKAKTTHQVHSTATKPVKQHNKTSMTETNNTETPANKITEIIDDFSMEKAVIYSEILKPKYEEY